MEQAQAWKHMMLVQDIVEQVVESKKCLPHFPSAVGCIVLDNVVVHCIVVAAAAVDRETGVVGCTEGQ